MLPGKLRGYLRYAVTGGLLVVLAMLLAGCSGSGTVTKANEASILPTTVTIYKSAT